jgi:hypothetical protein
LPEYAALVKKVEEAEDEVANAQDSQAASSMPLVRSESFFQLMRTGSETRPSQVRVLPAVLDAACDLFEAEKKNGGDRKKLPEYAALVKKVEEALAASLD